jgi:hypothetical protein
MKLAGGRETTCHRWKKGCGAPVVVMYFVCLVPVLSTTFGANINGWAQFDQKKTGFSLSGALDRVTGIKISPSDLLFKRASCAMS